MKVKYLCGDKIQVGKNDKFLFGYFSPQKESGGDSSCYAHMVCLGLYFICW